MYLIYITYIFQTVTLTYQSKQDGILTKMATQILCTKFLDFCFLTDQSHLIPWCCNRKNIFFWSVNAFKTSTYLQNFNTFQNCGHFNSINWYYSSNEKCCILITCLVHWQSDIFLQPWVGPLLMVETFLLSLCTACHILLLSL